MTAFRGVAARIQQALIDLQKVADRTARLTTKIDHTHDADLVDAIALNLHAFYTGAEHIFEAIARDIDGAVPGGPEWHRELLLQMSGGVTDVRPPVVGSATRACLDAYRGFRHVVRNAYTFSLDGARVRELAVGLPACGERLAADLSAFAAFLDSVG